MLLVAASRLLSRVSRLNMYYICNIIIYIYVYILYCFIFIKRNRRNTAVTLDKIYRVRVQGRLAGQSASFHSGHPLDKNRLKCKNNQ